MSEKNKGPHRTQPNHYYKSMEEFVRDQEVKWLLEKARAEEAAQAATEGGALNLVDIVILIIVLLIFLCLLPFIYF